MRKSHQEAFEHGSVARKVERHVEIKTLRTALMSLNSTYSFWSLPLSAFDKGQDWEASLAELCSFDTVADFWGCYGHIARASDVDVACDIYLFKKGVKPTWEDPANSEGGRWTIRVKKDDTGRTSRLFEKLVLAFLGCQFSSDNDITGVVVSVKEKEDTISVWNSSRDVQQTIAAIKDDLMRIFEVPEDALSYKPFFK